MPDRVKTGIEGLDKLMEGGFPSGSAVVLTGGPGVGKTTFCSQFIWEGVRNKENCLYLSTEEDPEQIKIEAKRFGWDFDENFNYIDIEYLDPDQDLQDQIEDLIEKEDFERIVLDSISTVGMQWETEGKIRKNANKILEELRGLDTTVLITAELADDESGMLSRYGVAEFIAEGVIKLDAKAMGTGLERTLTLLKMRATNIDGGIKDLDFTEKGIQIE